MAFATAEDIATRLGRELNEVEAATVDQLIEQATSLIAYTAGKDDEWADTLDPVPAAVKTVTVECVWRAMVNPEGAVSLMRQLGSFQHSATFPADAVGLRLTRDEERIVRRTVNGHITSVTLVTSWSGDDAAGSDLFDNDPV